MKNDLFGIFQHTTTTPLIYTQPLSKGTRMMMMIASPKQASLSLSLSRTQANQKQNKAHDSKKTHVNCHRLCLSLWQTPPNLLDHHRTPPHPTPPPLPSIMKDLHQQHTEREAKLAGVSTTTGGGQVLFLIGGYVMRKKRAIWAEEEEEEEEVYT
jgi:hypothetical protein